MPEQPPTPPRNLLGAPVLRRAGTVATPKPKSAGPVRRAIERPPVLWPYKLALVALLALVAVILVVLWTLGLDSFYATSGRVDIGRLRPYAAGPVEVYVLPVLPHELDAMSARHVRALLFWAKFDWQSPDTNDPLPPPTPRAPPKFGDLLRADMPPNAYGVSDGKSVAAYILPVAPEFREPKSPFKLSFLADGFYRKYNQKLLEITAERMRESVNALLDVVAADLAAARTDAQKSYASPDERLPALMQLKWLEAFEKFLFSLPNEPSAIKAQAAARAVEFSRDMPVLVNDEDFAAAAIGRAKVGSDGSFNAPGAGIVVVRVPLADGTGMYLTGMNVAFQGKIQSSSRFSPDFANLITLLGRSGEPLPTPSLPPPPAK